jgi:hemerythrin HHE cation binding domain-containing protein
MTIETVSIMFPASVRERVLEQHRVLRELLQQTLDATTRTFQPGGPHLDELARLVHDLRARFWAHLAFEERALVPVLAHLDLWGPERVQDLLAEHTRQRAQLETLVEGIEDQWDVERLAVALRSLATDLLLDMAEEEEGCVSAELLSDQMMVVDTARA